MGGGRGGGGETGRERPVPAHKKKELGEGCALESAPRARCRTQRQKGKVLPAGVEPATFGS